MTEEIHNFNLPEASDKITISSWFKENLLLALTIMGVICGVLGGSFARLISYSETVVMIVSFPGEIMMRMLKMLILPLIISSIVTGLASLDTSSSGKMGSRALMYYLSTTLLATILGISLVCIIHPGDPTILPGTAQSVSYSDDPNVMDALLDIIRNMFPDNLVSAMFSSTKTVYVKASVSSVKPLLTNISTNETTEEELQRSLVLTGGTNVMGMIVFCVVFGSTLGQLKNGKLMIELFTIMNDVIMKMVELIMWYSPFGIMSLVTGQIMGIKDLKETGQMLGLYMLTVISGLAIHATITLPTIYFVVCKKNPAVFFKGMLQAWITALGTGSSIFISCAYNALQVRSLAELGVRIPCSATLPITFRCLEDNNKIDKRVTRFVLPVGATVNMDGTALYEAVGSIFIAQMYGINLGIGELLTVSLTSTLASIGAASIPSAGLVTMLLVLTALGLPTEHASLIFAVDWILDRVRTSINVLGDAYGAAIVAHVCKEELMKAGPPITSPDGSRKFGSIKRLLRQTSNKENILVPVNQNESPPWRNYDNFLLGKITNTETQI